MSRAEFEEQFPSAAAYFTNCEYLPPYSLAWTAWQAATERAAKIAEDMPYSVDDAVAAAIRGER